MGVNVDGHPPHAIVKNDRAKVKRLLEADAHLATRLIKKARLCSERWIRQEYRPNMPTVPTFKQTSHKPCGAELGRGAFRHEEAI